MTHQQDIWNLLVSRQSEWVDRDDLNFTVGGDAAPLLSRLRTDVIASGEWRLDERKDQQKRTQLRLVPLPPPDPESEAARLRFQYRCTNCQSIPQSYASTQPTLDDRWRMGKCNVCRADPAWFRKVS
jgi:hypothetical protein